MTTIMLVEDEETLNETLSFLLQREGYEVSSVFDGPSALAMLPTVQPDLVLLDLMLPGL